MPAFCEEVRKSSNGYFTQDINSPSPFYPHTDGYIVKHKETTKFTVRGRSCKLFVFGELTEEIVATAPPTNKNFEELQERVVLLSCERISNCRLLTTVVTFGFNERYPIMGMFTEY